MNTQHLTPNALLSEAGLTAAVLSRIQHLLIGCGGFVRELIRHTGGASTSKDDPEQRLSAADELVDTLVREELLRLLPHSRGYSEEGGHFGDAQKGLHVHWLLDPVDGTRPALLGGAFAVSLGALVLDGETPLAALGWVYVPSLGALYHGRIGAGEALCQINGQPAAVDASVTPENLRHRYLATESNWHAVSPRPLPLKLSAAGSTAVHLTRLIHPESDVAAVGLTHYHSYDAAGALPAAVAGGAGIYPLDAHARPATDELDPLGFLYAGSQAPKDLGPHVMVCAPEVAEMLT